MASKWMMRKNIPAIVSAGRAAGLTDAIIIIPFMWFFVYAQTIRRPCPLEKDYVSCLSMPYRHTLNRSGTAAFALLRGGGGDGKRLTRGDADAACRPALIEPANSRPRG